MSRSTPPPVQHPPTRRAHRSGRARRHAAVVGALAIAVGATFSGLAAATSAPPASAAVSPSQQWVTAVSASTGTGSEVGDTRELTFGASGLTATERNTAISGTNECNMGGGSPLTMTAANHVSEFLSPTPPADAYVAAQQCRLRTATGSLSPSARASTVTFSKPVINPILHLINLDASYLYLNGASANGGAMAPTIISSNPRMTVQGDRFNNTLADAALEGCTALDGSNGNGACASVLLAANNDPIQQFTMTNSTFDSALAVNMDDGWAWSASFPTAPLTKAFSPAIVETGGVSHLTFTIANPANPQQPTLTPLGFNDDLPTGLTIANNSVTMTGCGPATTTGGGGGLLAAGATRVEVRNASVAVGATCQITVDVTSPTRGTYRNTTDNLSTTVANLIPNADTSVTFQKPGITIAKSAQKPVDVNGNGIVDLGDTIPYEFLVKNTGDVALTNVTVNDPKIQAVDCPATTLAVNGTMTCTGQYTVTAQDVTNGSVVNTATATGTPPTGPPVNSPPSTVTVVVTQPAPGLSLVKSASPATVGKVGDTVTYSFLVTNTGNVTMRNIGIDEGTFSGSGGVSEISCPAGAASLAPEASVTCTATYTFTQRDVDNGSVTNTATAHGTPPGADTPFPTPPSTTTVTAPPDAKLMLVKTADRQKLTAAGQIITYSFAATNTGNVTINNLVINEQEFSGTGSPSAIACPTTTVAPGATVTCTATYTVTQKDIDTGGVMNAATATGTPPGDTPPVTTPPSRVTVPAEGKPSISIVKSADLTDRAQFIDGKSVRYTFVLTNTGNTTLTDVSVEETAFSGSGAISAISCPADQTTSLAPDAQVVCTATYTLTQADVDAGEVSNTAVAHGTPPASVPGGPVTSPPSRVVLPGDSKPALDLVKTADTRSVVGAGQRINYRFAVTNTGNVTIHDAKVIDRGFTGSGELSAITCPAAIAKLAPGMTVMCSATYVTTAEDARAGRVSNTAVATGTPPGGHTPVESKKSTVVVKVTGAPTLPTTGAAGAWPTASAGVLLIGGGAAFALLRRRRRSA